jgi:hypothetical protein
VDGTIAAAMNRQRRLLICIVLFACGLAAFAAVAGSQLVRQSSDPHFVLLADAWLNGRLDIDPARKRGDDWATIETVVLDDGTQTKGRRLTTRPGFRIAGGAEVPIARVKRTVKRTHYVSFPPFPAVLMLPSVALFGHRANDVIITVFFAALALPLMFLVLVRLRDAGVSERGEREHIGLALTLAFGTVFFFSAVQGRVWYTAHVIGVVLALAYVWCSIEARHPILAGLCLGLATMTRTPMAFMFPLFLLQAWRIGGTRGFVRRAALFAAPIMVIAIVAAIHNHVRFGEATEFGHGYLAVRQQQQMETIGMFSLDYLSRNLAVAFALLPDFSAAAPHISISGHGLAMWFTTPVLVLLLWPRQRPALHRDLWLTVALVAVPTFLYQNSGWFQFGYRFSLDYMALLIVLLAVGGRPLTRVAKGLIIAGVIINLFGALTFNRQHHYYRGDTATYNVVVKH